MNELLKASGDRKTKFWDGQRNTFGLLPGRNGTCPMATIGDGGCCHIKPKRKNPECYVYNIMSAYPGVRGVLETNTKLLRDSTITQQTKLLALEFSRFHDIEFKRPEPKPFYRIHWAGDVFDQDYAIALSQAMNEFPDITFWQYTRCMPFVKFLANKTKNLLLYISLDTCNLLPGLQTYYDWRVDVDSKYDNVSFCYMSPEEDWEAAYERAYFQNELARTIAAYNDTGSELLIWPDKAPKLRPCPADTGKMPGEYCCSKCKGCITKPMQPVWFKS